jgi:Protein of unknown function (DUF2490)
MHSRSRSAVWNLCQAIGRRLLYPACLTAQAELQTQHIFDSSVAIGPVEPLWHFRVRTTPEGGGVAQIRTGPILNVDVHDRATLILGYYYTRAKEKGLWSTTHRSFGGVEGVLWNRKVEIDGRSILERHTLVSGPDFTRFRNRIRITPPGKTAPYAGVEVFVDTEGLRSVRYSAGLRRKIAESLFVDIGYFYENGRSATVADRHMIGTTVHWRDRSTRIDTDP